MSAATNAAARPTTPPIDLDPPRLKTSPAMSMTSSTPAAAVFLDCLKLLSAYIMTSAKTGIISAR